MVFVLTDEEAQAVERVFAEIRRRGYDLTELQEATVNRLQRGSNLDSTLALWFDPQSIRDHFDGNSDEIAEAVASATDEQLEQIAGWCLDADTLYSEFHRLLVEGARDVLSIPE